MICKVLILIYNHQNMDFKICNLHKVNIRKIKNNTLKLNLIYRTRNDLYLLNNLHHKHNIIKKDKVIHTYNSQNNKQNKFKKRTYLIKTKNK